MPTILAANEAAQAACPAQAPKFGGVQRIKQEVEIESVQGDMGSLLAVSVAGWTASRAS